MVKFEGVNSSSCPCLCWYAIVKWGSTLNVNKHFFLHTGTYSTNLIVNTVYVNTLKSSVSSPNGSWTSPLMIFCQSLPLFLHVNKHMWELAAINKFYSEKFNLRTFLIFSF